MISNRLASSMYSAAHTFNGHESRTSLMVNMMRKDVQVYHDSFNTSQLIEQMPIPLTADGQSIQVSEWLSMFTSQYCIPLNSAQYVNIWDPVEATYSDISSFFSFPSYNLASSSLLYIRYLPHQEIAVPPHANYLAMLEDSQNARINAEYSSYQQHDDTTTFQSAAASSAADQHHSAKFSNKESNSILSMLTSNNNNNNNYNNYNKSTAYLQGSTSRTSQPQQQQEQPQWCDILRSVKLEEAAAVATNLAEKHTQNIIATKKEEDSEESRAIGGATLGSCAANSVTVAKHQPIRKMSAMAGSSAASKRKDSELSEYGHDSQQKSKQQLAREKRVKERQISYVKEKVDEWRNLYEIGRMNLAGQLERVNLDVAAQEVGLSRKTLDDYYAQLRKAQHLGFDFEQNASEKMGSLRKYVKKMSENNINPLGNGLEESLDHENSSYKSTNASRHFNTPQLKPAHSSDFTKHDLTLSVGQKKTVSRKYSENTYDLLRSTSTFSALPLKPESLLPKQSSHSEETMLQDQRIDQQQQQQQQQLADRMEEEEDNEDEQGKLEMESQEDSLNYFNEGPNNLVNYEHLKHNQDLL